MRMQIKDLLALGQTCSGHRHILQDFQGLYCAMGDF